MKIIIVPDNPTIHGRRYRIAESLAVKGHDVHFIVWDFPYHMNTKSLMRHFFTSLQTKKYTHEDITVHRFGRLPYYWPHINGLLFRYQLKKLFRQLAADIVITESYTNETEVPKSLPFIYDIADDYAAPADVYGSPFYKFAFKLLGVRATMRRQCQNALAVTVLSEALYKFAKQYNKQTFKLPDGVEREQIEEVQKDPSTYPVNKYGIVYVTGFGKWSRPIETMKTVMDLKKEFPTIDLTLIGDGTEAEEIKQFIDENQFEDFIHFLGFIHDRKTLFTYINKSTVGLNISDKNKWRDAAHPIKVLEYSAMGKKVVSTDLAEVEALGFPNIFLFSDSKNGPSFKDALRNALLSDKTETDFSDVSAHVMEEYSWDKLTNDLLDLIEEIKK
jgi:glycosyltransferase involved in cell wall biosynthesis